jgi:hypothetical protein
MRLVAKENDLAHHHDEADQHDCAVATVLRPKVAGDLRFLLDSVAAGPVSGPLTSTSPLPHRREALSEAGRFRGLDVGLSGWVSIY